MDNYPEGEAKHLAALSPVSRPIWASMLPPRTRPPGEITEMIQLFASRGMKFQDAQSAIRIMAK